MTTVLSGGHTGSVLCVDIQRNGDQLVATGGEYGQLCIWQLTGQLVKKLVRPDEDCGSVCFSKENNDVLYSAFDSSILIFSLGNFTEPVEIHSFNEDEINQIAVDEKEHFLAACDDSGEIKILDLKEKRVFKTLRLKHTNICSSVCFRPRKPWEVFTGGLDCKLIHWDFSRPKCLNIFNMQELHNTSSELEAYMVNPPFIHNLAISSNGRYLACALENGLVAVFDARRKHVSELFSLHAHSQGVSQVCFASDNYLLSGGNDCSIILWDLDKSDDVDPASHQNGTSVNGSSHGASNGVNGQTGQANHEDEKNETVSGACKVMEIQHSGKINWMKPFQTDGQNYVAIADQSCNVTLIPLEFSVQ